MSTAKESGMLVGGGVKTFKRGPRPRKALKSGLPNVHVTDSWAVKQLPQFDPALADVYTKRELMLLTEKMLLEDEKDLKEPPYVLSMSMYRERQRKEVYTAGGIPDPSYIQGMYWRTHPQGRKFTTDGKNGESFYR